MSHSILLIVAVICALNWLNRYICCLALLLYISKKYNTLPAGEELKACLREAWKRTLHMSK